MNSALKENWNSRVRKKDFVVVVGDFAFKRHRKWLCELNGKKILVKGNHDKMSKDVLSHFSSVHDHLLRKINGQHIFFCHYAMRTWPGPYRRTWHLYGHSHHRLYSHSNTFSCDVGVDGWNYAPVSMEQISELMRKKEQETCEKEGYFSNM